MDPAEGERRAAIGFTGQYGLAATIVYEHLSTLEWIHLADPDAGIADDFQFKAGPTRHALQVKWAQYPESFTWSALTSTTASREALFAGLAGSWATIRTTWDGPLSVHLCTNGQPSVSGPPETSALGSATVSGPKHLAAFLERSFRPVQTAARAELMDLGTLRSLDVFAEWIAVWTELQRISGLADDDFLRFIEDLEFDFGVKALDGSPSTLDGPVDLQAHNDLRTLAFELQACVADPARPQRLDRVELLARLGWGARLRYRNRHEFPVPGTYTPNRAAIGGLYQALANLTGGYLALIGPAGSGKSTLLSDITIAGRVVRYYAFVPDSPNPLTHRGEAESFLNDLSLALEDAGIFRSGQPSGLPGLRHCLEQQLIRAQEAWSERGEKTVIIIDGLDHIPREQNPSRSLLEELPAPSGLGDGVFVILGSQTASVLSADIQDTLTRPGRTVTLPPLSNIEVRELAEQAGLLDWLWPGQIDTFVEVVEGHPLAATYLLSELSALPLGPPGGDQQRVHADRILADASSYRGDIERRYRGYFQAVRTDNEVVALLSSVARLRTSLNLRWLTSWSSGDVVSRFASSTKTFFRVEGDEWQFVHNSFRRFLADETARIDGVVSVDRDRNLHLDLAHRCAASGDDWPTYRDEEVAHRFMAGDDERVLVLVTPTVMRTKLRALQSAHVIKDQTDLGLRSSARIGNETAFVRLALFTAELAQREQAFSAEQLATALAGLPSAPSAIDYVVRGSRVRIATNTAAMIAASWAAQGKNADAAKVLNSLGGLNAFSESRVARSGESDGVADWAVATFHVSGLGAVLAQVESHLPLPKVESPSLEDNSENVDQSQFWRIEREHEDLRHRRLEALTACFDELLEIRDFVNLDSLGEQIEAEGNITWRARCRLMRALAAATDGDTEETVAQIRRMLELERSSKPGDQPTESRVPLGFRLRAAVTLLSLGLSGSQTFRSLIAINRRPTMNDDPVYQPEDMYGHVVDFETIHHYLTLANVKNPSITPPAAISTNESKDTGATRASEAGTLRNDAGRKRFHVALLALARLRAEALAAREGLIESPAVAGRAAEIFRVIEVPRETTKDWLGWYRVRDAFPSLLTRTIRLAYRVGGSAELLRLTRVLDLAWTGERAKYWSVEFRHAALEQFTVIDHSCHEWVRQELDTVGALIFERSYDPQSQVEAWLKHAEIRTSLSQRTEALDAVVAAVDSSLGLGMSDDDEQLSQWIGWLTTAARCEAISEREHLAAIDRFATRLPGASYTDERVSATAAQRLVRESWQISPMSGYRVGIALSDVGALPEVDLIVSALAGSLDTQPASAQRLSVLVATEMLLPVTGRDRDGVIERLRKSAPDEERHTIDRSMQIWGLVEDDDAAATTQATYEADTSLDQLNPREVTVLPDAQTGSTPTALLALLRTFPDDSKMSEEWWATFADNAFHGPIQVNVARALVHELGRLLPSNHALGRACGALAAAGDLATARQTLQIRLTTLPSSGWFRHYDGGTRRKLFAGALHAGAPGLARLALSDLAETIAGGVFAWTRFADELREILELVAGPKAVGSALPDVDNYLDIIAPADPKFRPGSLGRRLGAIEDTSTGALAAMVGDYLGHPAKAGEEGSRRVFVRLLTEGASDAPSRTATLAALEDAVERGGWPAESALSVLLLSALDQPPATLIEALHRAAVGKDQIIRDLARELCVQWGRPSARPPRRELTPDVST